MSRSFLRSSLRCLLVQTMPTRPSLSPETEQLTKTSIASAYAPQLATRLNLNGVQSNLVGACGNAGVYLTGPLVGRVVDANGPRKPLLFSAAVLFVGYEIIRYIYDGGVDGPFRTFGVFGLAVGQFLTGSGSSSALSAAANGVAKSFGQKRRASAMSMVTAGFGLSAFFCASNSRLDQCRC